MDLADSLERTLQEFLRSFEGVNFNFNFGSNAIAVAAYIFMALGLSAIARNRGIRNPWLAWIPVANLWLLGCISDQYRYVTRGEERNRRKRMLTLGILELTVAPLMVLLLCGWIFGMYMVVEVGGNGEPGGLVILLMIGLLLAVIALLVALIVIAIILQVQRCYAFYDLFSSCVPQRKKLYSALSIVASCLGIDLVAAIFIFLCRDKEEGMPPRIPE